MRVAIFEPQMRLCGVTAYDFHLAAGFRALGHHCDVVTFTKSGKAAKHGTPRTGWQWWITPPDVVAKIDSAVEVLDTYDLIVLNEPKNGTLDRRSIKEGTKPYYILALTQTRTPWMTVLHDTRYTDSIAPYLHECLTAGPFTGVSIQHQYNCYEMNAKELGGLLRVVQPWPWLPYERAPAATEEVTRLARFGILGRIAANKGQPTLMSIADELPPGWEVLVAGNEPGGMGACVTYLAWEGLTRTRGWTGFREGNGKRPANDEANIGGDPPPADVFNYGDKLKCWPFYVRKGQNAIRYIGPYEDGVETLRSCAVSVNLTSPDFSRTLEYTTLEAIDAGCVIVTPQHCLDVTPGPYQFFTLQHWNGVAVAVGAKDRGFRSTKFDGAPHDELVGALREAATAAIGDPMGWGGVQQNRALLASQHSPHLLANQILQLVGGGQVA